MRDIGILVWVALLVIGVTGSMISSVRRQMQAAQQGRSPGRPVRRQQIALPATATPASPPQPQPPSRPKVRQQPAPSQAPEMHLPRRERGRFNARFFANKRSLVQSVIAAEVLGKPRAFNDEYTLY
ncbi:MAG TPA: hypothetical protein VEW74_03385 [Candidatus Nitrosotalea sp.]|nr:hypothetical protein [Candidatus Nitrosotalea sp.]